MSKLSNKQTSINMLKSMELDKKMDDIIKNGIKSNKEPIAIKKPNSNDESSDNKSLRDLNYQLQMDKILGEALQADDSKPRRIVSHVTEEMIKEYKDEANKPILITDDHGVKHSYKYHPASTIPDFEAYPPLNPVPNELALNALIQDEIDKIDHEQLEIDKHTADIANIVDILNKRSYRIPYPKFAKPAGKAIIDKENSDKRQELLDAKLNLEFAITVNETNIRGFEAEIAKIRGDIANIATIIADNQAIISKTDSDNKQKIREYAIELNNLNSGQFDTNKFANETDEEYLDRLKQNAQTPADNSYLEVEAELSNMKKFKENMKYLLSSDTSIESIMRNLDTDDIFKINSVFSIIKEQYLKTFGYNNKNIKLNEITDFLINYAYQRDNLLTNIPNNIKASSSSLALVPATAMAPAYAQVNPDVILINDKNSCIFINNNSGNQLHFKLSNKQDVGEKKRKRIVMASLDGSVGSYVSVTFSNKDSGSPRYFMNLLVDVIGLTKSEINKMFDNKITLEKIENWLSNDQKLTEENATKYDKVAVPGKQDEHIYGMGLHLEEIPKFCQFGKIFIQLDKLFYKNVLVVKDHNKMNIHGFKNCPVSDEFVELIMRMCKGHKPSPSDLKNLKINEKEIFDMLIYISGNHKTIHSTKDSTAEKLKLRLELVEGEIEAGNNNIELLDELRDLLNKLSNLGVIAKPNAKKHYDSIKKDFFY